MKYIKGLIAVMGIIAVSALLLQPTIADFNATQGAQATAQVNVTISVTLTNTSINFPSLVPGTVNRSGNQPLNISIDSPATTVNVNITQNATNFTTGSLTFPITNLIYSNFTAGINATMQTTFPSPPPFADWINITAGSYRNTSYYLSIPTGTQSGTFTSTLTVNASQFGT